VIRGEEVRRLASWQAGNDFGVRRQSEAATALWIGDRLAMLMSIQSGVVAAALQIFQLAEKKKSYSGAC
jgi:transcription initiation factor TFIIIB Brf1 subunit/transcription initiation factor TFIIB